MLAVLGAVILAGASIQGVNWVSLRMLKGRLEPQYAVVQELRQGMSHDDVDRLVARHRSRHLSQQAFADGGVTIWTQYSLMDVCYTTLEFRQGTLVSSRTSGEDTPQDRCPGAPPDLR